MRQAGRYMAEYRALRAAARAAGDLPRAGPGHRGDAAAAATHRGGRGHPVLRSADSAGAAGAAVRLRRRRRPAARAPAVHGRRHRRACAASSRARNWASCCRRSAKSRQELNGQLPLIGFAGAPFTLASYAIEGGHSNSFAKTKALMFGHPDAWHRLCGTAGRAGRRLPGGADRSRRRCGAGVRLVGGSAERRRLPPSSRSPTPAGSSRSSAARAPTIHFGTGTAMMLDVMREAGGDVIGADWRIPIDEAWDRIGHDRGIQGNLDPTTLLGPVARMCRQVDDIIERVGGRRGPHLQPRPRHPADHAARTRADAGQLRPPRDGAPAAACVPDSVDDGVTSDPPTSSSSAAASPAWRQPTT